jgi:hypothetical protein
LLSCKEGNIAHLKFIHTVTKRRYKNGGKLHP